MLRLTDDEKALLDGRQGHARRKAMELLVRYAEALGAERFVDTSNVAGVPGSANAFLQSYYAARGQGAPEAIFSFFDLDSDELVEAPRAAVSTCHLQGGADPRNWRTLGVAPELFAGHQAREAFAARRGVQILKTCTPYLAGNVPVRGEHLAWMESSAVVYANSVIGARTNTEGRESTSAAMLTGKIPDFGLHRDEGRVGTHHVVVEASVESVLDWGLLGYFIGDRVQEQVPVVVGRHARPDLVRLKHFGAAASSSGGVELYHLVGVTPEAETVEMAYRGQTPRHTFTYGPFERRAAYERLSSSATDADVDIALLGCPHAGLEQIAEAAVLLDGRRISDGCRLWIFTSRAVRSEADGAGYTRVIEAAGGVVLTDTCSAFARAIPPGTKVVAVDSAKQAHYLPAILGVQAWFGSTRDCVDAALTGRWSGRCP
jgi:predicted aconitase